MHVDYEISEQDFRDGQRLAIKNSSVRFVRWTRWVLPFFGLLLSIFIIHTGLKQGPSVRLLPGLLMSLFFLSIPLLSKREQNKLYAKSNSLHGRLSLDVNAEGMEFSGQTFSSHVTWEHYGRFLEDDKAFVLYQKNERIFNILPKRNLTTEQIAEIRQYLKLRLGAKS